MIKYSHNFKKTVSHRNIKNELTDKFIMFDIKNETKNRIKYFLSIYWKLQLLIIFLNLLIFNDHFDFKVDAMKLLFKKKEFHLSWLRHLLFNKEFIIVNLNDSLQQLIILIDETFKIKTLLKNVRNQISYFYDCERFLMHYTYY